MRVRAASCLGVFLVCGCGPIGGIVVGGDAPDAGGGGALDAGGGSDAPRPIADAGERDSGVALDAGGAPGPAPSAPGGYTVSGATIYTRDHVPHLFHGLDRPSLEWSAAGDQLSEGDYQRMATDWKANVVRIALNQGFWLQGSKVYAAGYRDVIDQNVRWAEQAGMDVILDLHWSDRGDFQTTPDQQRMADAHSATFWSDVATRYKGDGRVLFELYNEPHDVPWDVWQHGGPSGDGFTAVGMQELYDAVRAAGAENLVLIGGLSFAYDLSGVPSHRIQGHNIVYATHPYNHPGKQPGNWDAGFGNLAQTDPVIATEFGDMSGCGSDYNANVIAYAKAHGISWTGWAWYVSGCGFPSLISDWNGTPTTAGKVVRDALRAF